LERMEIALSSDALVAKADEIAERSHRSQRL
jgi:hypothetical protein